MTRRWYLHPAIGYAGTLTAVALLTEAMWSVHEDLLPGATALMYLLVVFLASLAWGMGPALVGAVVASLCFDYFFTPPAWTLTGFKTQTETVMYLTFFVVTVVTSRLTTRANLQAVEARLRAREASILYELGRALSEAENVDAAMSTTCERLVSSFGVESCTILFPDGHDGFSSPNGAAGLDADAGAAARAVGQETIVAHGRTVLVPFHLGPGRTGVLRVGPRAGGQPVSPREYPLLRTFANAASTAIDRRRLREVITKAELLQQSDQLKSALMSSVSHDLRTPLAAIKAAITALLQDRAWNPADQREALEAANNEVDRLTRLIGNLLDVSRIEAGALRPDRQWYEIGELIRDAARRVDGRVRSTIAVDVPDGLPPVFVDYVQIQQVVTNLIENAAKYAPDGTSVEIEAAQANSDLIVRVRDRGPGVPAEEADRIFSKFYRVGRQRGEGTGLGLAICRGLVEAHGGHICLENPGRPGAVFAFTLPVGTPPETARMGG